MYTYMHPYINVCTYVCLRACIHSSKKVCSYACTYVPATGSTHSHTGMYCTRGTPMGVLIVLTLGRLLVPLRTTDARVCARACEHTRVCACARVCACVLVCLYVCVRVPQRAARAC